MNLSEQLAIEAVVRRAFDARSWECTASAARRVLREPSTRLPVRVAAHIILRDKGEDGWSRLARAAETLGYRPTSAK